MSIENFSEEEVAAVIAIKAFFGLYQQMGSPEPISKIDNRWRFAGRLSGFMFDLPR